MTVDLSSLPRDTASFVAGIVAAGRYQSIDEVVLAGLRLLEKDERCTAAFRSQIDEGIADFDRGDFVPVTDAAAHRAIFDALKAQLATN